MTCMMPIISKQPRAFHYNDGILLRCAMRNDVACFAYIKPYYGGALWLKPIQVFIIKYWGDQCRHAINNLMMTSASIALRQSKWPNRRLHRILLNYVDCANFTIDASSGMKCRWYLKSSSLLSWCHEWQRRGAARLAPHTVSMVICGRRIE